MIPFNPPASPLRILIADDEPSIRLVLELFFLEEGHEVMTAADGEEALALFRHGNWDVVFTDRVMPRMSGDALAVEIHKISPGMPVVLVTGYADLSPSGDARQPNFHMIVRKPFTRETLRAALSTVQQQMLAAA
jgi:DNA-binding NtrC family response regulator